MSVTVVIPFFNAERYIYQAINSVFEQTFQEWKLILINDASTDDSLSMIQPFLKDSRVTLLQHNENKGQSVALNSGLSNVMTPFLIQLDADDYYFPDTLHALVTEAKSVSEDVAVIGGNVQIAWEKKNRIRRKKVIKGRPFHDVKDFLSANMSVWPRFYRTSALHHIGGWPTDDPWSGRHAEDIRVITRLLEKKYAVHWINKTLLFNRRHSKNDSNNSNRYGDVFEWIVIDALNRLEDPMKPIFKTYHNGWKQLIRFEEE
ncbi:glycosyltransferase family 2 protein [Bacillus timonensis]|uniref:glycosyltransferase family 2 protein n=1 Tax=Bacillus timonensis TaxID=1033734 RepID=UPI0002894141|nr:glycosyltransferase family 2 protein [Bacillus timonensis]